MDERPYRVLRSFSGTDASNLSVVQGQLVTLQEAVTVDTIWVLCMDHRAKKGLVPVSHLDVQQYEDHRSTNTEECDSAEDEDLYDDCYVPIDQRYFHCIKKFKSDCVSVRVGDFVVDLDGKWMDGGDGRLWRRVQRRTPVYTEGDVPKDCLEAVSPLEDQKWYVGNASRNFSEEFLKADAVLNSTFLVRFSVNTEGYVISYKCSADDIRHKKIQRTATDEYTVVSGVKYGSVLELVYNHHYHNPHGFKMHHEYNKFGRGHARALRNLGQSSLYQRAIENINMNDLPPPERKT